MTESKRWFRVLLGAVYSNGLCNPLKSGCFETAHIVGSVGRGGVREKKSGGHKYSTGWLVTITSVPSFVSAWPSAITDKQNHIVAWQPQPQNITEGRGRSLMDTYWYHLYTRRSPFTFHDPTMLHDTHLFHPFSCVLYSSFYSFVYLSLIITKNKENCNSHSLVSRRLNQSHLLLYKITVSVVIFSSIFQLEFTEILINRHVRYLKHENSKVKTFYSIIF